MTRAPTLPPKAPWVSPVGTGLLGSSRHRGGPSAELGGASVNRAPLRCLAQCVTGRKRDGARLWAGSAPGWVARCSTPWGLSMDMGVLLFWDLLPQNGGFPFGFPLNATKKGHPKEQRKTDPCACLWFPCDVYTLEFAGVSFLRILFKEWFNGKARRGKPLVARAKCARWLVSLKSLPFAKLDPICQQVCSRLSPLWAKDTRIRSWRICTSPQSV